MKAHRLVLAVALVGSACGEEEGDEVAATLSELGDYELLIHVDGRITDRPSPGIRDSRRLAVDLLFDVAEFAQAHDGRCARLDHLRAGTDELRLEILSRGGRGGTGECLPVELATPSSGLPDESTLAIADDSTSIEVALGPVGGSRSVQALNPSEPIYQPGQTIELGYAPIEELEEGRTPSFAFWDTGDFVPAWVVEVTTDVASGRVTVEVPADAPLGPGGLYLLAETLEQELPCEGAARCLLEENVAAGVDAIVE